MSAETMNQFDGLDQSQELDWAGNMEAVFPPELLENLLEKYGLKNIELKDAMPLLIAKLSETVSNLNQSISGETARTVKDSLISAWVVWWWLVGIRKWVEYLEKNPQFFTTAWAKLSETWTALQTSASGLLNFSPINSPLTALFKWDPQPLLKTFNTSIETNPSDTWLFTSSWETLVEWVKNILPDTLAWSASIIAWWWVTAWLIWWTLLMKYLYKKYKSK